MRGVLLHVGRDHCSAPYGKVPEWSKGVALKANVLALYPARGFESYPCRQKIYAIGEKDITCGYEPQVRSSSLLLRTIYAPLAQWNRVTAF